ncbi:GNAT family N-acetyltransferase [Vagococcus intermedius]|uniref:GNAT family N-acetyltransferase n=1 Tax=Vagococcus intermedius TaxID=2991418 RepID=A0AAF0I719_9ENTE|nr:GNAT family N-acetyltransferase [Vagococcus intermedius]WEG72706.1 GNAT family N-acetyltransferase [Vagococcus intermedius]WEG74791.1 GNAT family N-acetyltransferase [Vagococcus intermedius]
MITLASQADIPELMRIFNQGTAYFKALGIDQWQGSYPEFTVLEQDITAKQCYVKKEEGMIVGTIVVSLLEETCYGGLKAGAWRYDEPYTVIHRLAINREHPTKGVSYELLAWAERVTKLANRQVIRVDTHADNKGMQHILTKVGYELVGEVMLDDGGQRVVLDKKVK